LAKWLNRSLVLGPYLTVVRSEAEYNRALKKVGVPVAERDVWRRERWNGATTHSFDNDEGDLCCIVTYYSDNTDPVEVSALMAHEAVHIWRRYCDHIGEDCPSDELSAYAIQHITLALSAELIDQFSNMGA
jgi:hypothetical protein